MTARRAGPLVALFVTAAVGYVVLSGSDDDGAGTEPSARAAAAGAQATCATGGPGSTRVSSRNDAVLGPLVLIGARYAGSRPPDAFGGRGYKIPVTLPKGLSATLSVPRGARRQVGLVFSLDTQDRAIERGVKGADHSVRFTACPGEGAAQRTGWTGGFVVDRRRCAALVLTVASRRPKRHRVPLGRRC